MGGDFLQQKEMLELKYRLKKELEELVHKNVMEELVMGTNLERKNRRGN